MNWLWILMLAGLGIVLNVVMLVGWIPSSIWLSVGFVLIVAIALGYNVNQKLFLNGFLTAMIWSLVGGALQFMFWDTFIANNPDVLEKLSKLPEGMDIRPWMAAGIVFVGATWGAVLGLLAMLAGKLLGEKSTAESPAPAPNEAEKADITGQ